jgi:hypothetical protein
VAEIVDPAQRLDPGPGSHLSQRCSTRCAGYPTLFGALVAATTWRAGFALVALFPLAGYVVLRRVA